MKTYINNQTVFNQILHLMKNNINYLKLGQQDKYAKKYSWKDLLLILLYAQITWKSTLREIETSLECNESKLYHCWTKKITKSSLGRLNNKIDSKVFEDLFYNIVNKFSICIWKNDLKIPIKTIALDSSIISLPFAIYDWAKYRTTKWWIRLHTWLELDNFLPRFMIIDEAKKSETTVAEEIIDKGLLRENEMVVFDRYYVDFDLRKKIDEQNSFFVTRNKKNIVYDVIGERPQNHKDIYADLDILLSSENWKKKYDKKLRLVFYYDEKSWELYEYITNNFDLEAIEIANIYKYRRKIEEFFRWIKQNLKIKEFLWTSKNAVLNQIYIAMIYYVLLQYLNYSWNLSRDKILKLSRIMSEKCMEYMVISEIFVLCRSRKWLCISGSPPNSWTLFDGFKF